MSSSSASRRHRRWGPYQCVMGLFWAAPAGALLLAYLALPDHISRQCAGVGFGCLITPKDGTVLLAVYVYPLVVIAGLLIMGSIAMGRALHRAWARCGITGRGAGVAPPLMLSPTCPLVVALPLSPATWECGVATARNLTRSGSIHR
jgi:hypothetical protein